MSEIKSNTISLKELREQFPKYIDAISKGNSFVIVKRSKPIFQINPIADEGSWTTIADFTDISSDGVSAEDLLSALDKQINMTDKIQKILSKLSAKEKEIVKLLILRVKLDDTLGLNISQLKGHTDLFRVKRGRIRVVYRKNAKEFLVIKIDRRNEKTYKDLQHFAYHPKGS